MIPVFQILRLRMNTDGGGITTLVGVSGCPNRCEYCINYAWFSKKYRELTAKELYDLVAVDDVYFRATGGGVTFGGGEPMLWPDAICEFARLVNEKWKLRIETSLNVPWENVEAVIPYIDTFIIDIKDMREDIYTAYTGNSGLQMRENLVRLAQSAADHIAVRVPLIPEYNTREDLFQSKAELLRMGIDNIELFKYRKCETHWLGQDQMRRIDL